MRELEVSLLRARLERDALALRKDELESVLAVGRLGFCRLAARTRALSANSQFKAEFGWPPDAEITWRELEERIQRGDWLKLANAVEAAFREGEEVYFIVRTRLMCRERQWITLCGRSVNSGSDATNLIM